METVSVSFKLCVELCVRIVSFHFQMLIRSVFWDHLGGKVMGFIMLVNGLLVRRRVGGRGISKLERRFWKSMKETMSISTLDYFGGFKVFCFRYCHCNWLGNIILKSHSRYKIVFVSSNRANFNVKNSASNVFERSSDTMEKTSALCYRLLRSPDKVVKAKEGRTKLNGAGPWYSRQLVRHNDMLIIGLSLSRSHSTVVNSYDLTTCPPWVQAPNGPCRHT